MLPDVSGSQLAPPCTPGSAEDDGDGPGRSVHRGTPLVKADRGLDAAHQGGPPHKPTNPAVQRLNEGPGTTGESVKSLGGSTDFADHRLASFMVVLVCLTDTSTDTTALRRRRIVTRLRATGQATGSVVPHGLESQVAPRSARISAGRAVSPSGAPANGSSATQRSRALVGVTLRRVLTLLRAPGLRGGSPGESDAQSSTHRAFRRLPQSSRSSVLSDPRRLAARGAP